MSRSAAVDGTQEQTVSETVISRVAERTGTNPLSMEPLYATLDPDALDELFEPDPGTGDGSDGRITFTYNGCIVEVSADGTVHVSNEG